MEIETRLTKEKSMILRRIAAAAQEGDTPGVMSLGTRLQRVERLIRQLEELRREFETLDKPPEETGEPGAGAPYAPLEPTEDAGPRSTGRDRGTRRRLEFVKTLPPAARPLEPVTRAVFLAPELKRRIGVAYAREGKKDRWFLGLHDGKFDHAVLLCESSSGKLTHFSLPPEFMERHRAGLSRRDHQLKFNVLKRSGEFFLLIRPGRHISLEPYRDNYYGLR